MSDSPISQKYRNQAKRLQEQAARALYPDIPKQFEDLAREYDLLADSNEQREKRQGRLD